ncbi:hypothetical protein PG987_005095 [Apiospora arundinis]
MRSPSPSPSLFSSPRSVSLIRKLTKSDLLTDFAKRAAVHGIRIGSPPPTTKTTKGPKTNTEKTGSSHRRNDSDDLIVFDDDDDKATKGDTKK